MESQHTGMRSTSSLPLEDIHEEESELELSSDSEHEMINAVSSPHSSASSSKTNEDHE
jgi:hypothetical protein